MPLTRMLLTHETTAAQQTDQMGLGASDRYKDGQGLGNYFSQLPSGTRSRADVFVNIGVTRASGTLTVAAGGSANGQTCTIANVTFTGVSGTPTGNQFQVSATAATQAANMAAAINASANLAAIVSASAALGVVTITANIPGLMGNGLQLSAGTLANVTAAGFSGGSDGTSYQIDMR